MTPHRAQDPYDWAALLGLLQREFAYMDARVDPPSSIHRLTAAELARQAMTGEIWVIGTPPVACMVLTLKPHALYIGKVAVAASHRGRGLARRLISLAEDRARALGLPALELQVRVELTENHAIYQAMGFRISAETAHPGYDHPTSYTFIKPL